MVTRKPPPPAAHQTIDILAVLTADVHPLPADKTEEGAS